jgi:hypothetical protein
MLYPAKKDWWLAGMLLVNGLLLVGVGVAVPFLDAGGAGRPNPASPIPLVLVGLLLAGTGVLLLWVLFGAAYEVAPPDLLVRLGPFRRRIPLWDIVEAVPRRGLAPDWGWGLALSLDRLRISYRKSGGRMALPIVISPADRDGFLAELAAVAPRLHFTEDGALRLAAEGRTEGTS